MSVIVYCKFFSRFLGFLVILLSIQNIEVVSKNTDNEEKCIWFDECGPDPTPGRSSKTLNCAYDGPPGRYIHLGFTFSSNKIKMM